MRQIQVLTAGVFAVLSSAAGVAAESGDPFTPFAAIPAAERLPRGAALTVGEDGTFRVNGEPRYLTATIVYGDGTEFARRTSGYPDELRWLYEAIPDFEGMQRLGIDAMGFEAGHAWMRTVNPTGAPGWVLGCEGWPKQPAFPASSAGMLPMYVDLTAASWSHGAMTAKLNPALPADAWTSCRNHWVPYSVESEAGRNLWLTMWRETVKECAAMPVKPYVYELMNEPAYGDLEGAKTIRERIERQKRHEEAFASLVGEGAAVVHAGQPGAFATLQPLGHAADGVNLYEVYRRLDLICSPTGGGGLVGGHLLRALADGKAIVDGETYIGTTVNSIRGSLISEYQRGFNASYTFKWSRRPRDWAHGGDVEKERVAAQKISPYNYLNPYQVEPAALNGFRLAKRDILEVNEFFTPRDRGLPRKVAVLMSNPTDRLRRARDRRSNARFKQALTELDYAHLEPDVVFEEQLRDEPARLDRYRVLVAAGIEATLPTTAPVVAAWLQRGNTLVMTDSDLGLDEYGERREGTDLVGDVRVVSAEGVPSEVYAARLTESVTAAGISPSCETRGERCVEVTGAVRNGMRAWILTLRAFLPAVVGFRPAVREEMTAVMRTVMKDGAAITCRRELEPDADGVMPLFLKPGEPLILVAGPREKLGLRYPESPDAKWLSPLAADEVRKVAEDAFAKERRRREAENRARMRPPAAGAVTLDPANLKLGCWNPPDVFCPEFRDGVLFLSHGEHPQAWSGCALRLKKPVALPASESGTVLAFEIARIRNRWGQLARHPMLQMAVDVVGVDGRKRTVSSTVKNADGLKDFEQTPEDEAAWTTVQVDLGRFDGALSRFNFQYMGNVGIDPGAVKVRGFRLEPK